MADAAAVTPTGTKTQEVERTTTTTTQASIRTGTTIPLETGKAQVSWFLNAPSFCNLFAHSFSTRRLSPAAALATLAVVGQAGGHVLAALA
jgi:hypothetical protein